MNQIARIIMVFILCTLTLTQLAYAIPTRLDFTATLRTATIQLPYAPNFTGYVLYDSSTVPSSTNGHFDDITQLFNSIKTYQGNVFSLNGLIGTTFYSINSNTSSIEINNDGRFLGSSALDEMVIRGVDNISNSSMLLHINKLGHYPNPPNLFSDSSLPTSLTISTYTCETDSQFDIYVGGHTLFGHLNSMQVTEIPHAPEPSSLILLAAGVGGLALWGRKRKITG